MWNQFRRMLFLYPVSVLVLAIAAFPSQQDSSEKETISHALKLIHKLEEEPLHAHAQGDREWLWQWLSTRTPEKPMNLCGPPIEELFQSGGPYGNILFTQSTLSAVAFVFEHPEQEPAGLELMRASLQGVLRAYAAIRKAQPDQHIAILDDLEEKQRRGELDTVLQERLKICPASGKQPAAHMLRDPDTGGYGATLLDAIANSVQSLNDEQMTDVRSRAREGQPAAELILGVAYYLGHNVPQSFDRAKEWLRRAAEHGSVGGATFLGFLHAELEDPAAAAVWYRVAADAGGRDAQYELGRSYEEGIGVEKSLKDAEHWYRLSAEAGRPEAQVRLGDMYNSGRGVEEDEGEAVKWFRKAAEGNSLMGQVRLAEAYYYGEGVERSYTEAAKWYQHAAGRGHVESQLQFGLMLRDGQGRAKDLVSAYSWFLIAARQGSAGAQDEADRLSKLLTPDQLQKAGKQADEWMKAIRENQESGGNVP